MKVIRTHQFPRVDFKEIISNHDNHDDLRSFSLIFAPSIMKGAFIKLHIAVFLAGITGILGKLITLNESLLVWYRMLITAVTLWIIYAFRKKIVPVSFKDLLQMIGVGAIVATHWVAFYGSIKYANVSVSLVCLSLMGFFSALMEPILLRKRIAFQEVLLGMVSVVGIALIFHFDIQYKIGIIFGIVAAFLASLFTILNKMLLSKHDSGTVTLYELSGGFIVLTCVMPFYLSASHIGFSLPAGLDWVWLLILSWLCTVLAFYISLDALKDISPFTVNLTYNLEPVYGILLAFVLFHENKYLSNGFYVGVFLIFVAVILQMVRVRKKVHSIAV
ncbi:DMT family transporter [Chitinophagaceae bacterium 26-R-25]|nr:DMT family transporter [Chitinophagaceae bacterium 26-R-25]